MKLKVGRVYKTLTYLSGVKAQENDVRIILSVGVQYVHYKYFIMDNKTGEIRCRVATITKRQFEDGSMPYKKWLKKNKGL